MNQVPFKEIFQHMLLVQEEEGTGTLRYEVMRTSARGLLKLFAFARCLIELFHTGLTTFSQVCGGGSLFSLQDLGFVAEFFVI